jgi:hypothetical protein
MLFVAREVRPSVCNTRDMEIVMATQPAPVPERFQSVFGRLKAQRHAIAALAVVTAVILFLFLVGPLADQLSERFAQVVSDSGVLDRPLGLWTLSYIGDLFVAFFSALIMSFVSIASNALFLPLVAAIGVAWIASK